MGVREAGTMTSVTLITHIILAILRINVVIFIFAFDKIQFQIFTLFVQSNMLEKQTKIEISVV